MSIKLKALGLGLVAAMAMAAFAAVNASALSGTGHFTHDAPTNHATIVGTENGAPHDLVFKREGTGDPGITCTHAAYHGLAPAKTVTSVTVTPTYTNCATEDEPVGAWGNVTVTMNGCAFNLFSRTAGHGTVEVHCPVGKAIEIHHPNCTITVPAQKPSETTMTGGIIYDTTTEGGKHTLTPTVTVKKITGHFHGGICIFLGTSHKFEMNGALTVEGKDTAGNRVNITHT